MRSGRQQADLLIQRRSNVTLTWPKLTNGKHAQSQLGSGRLLCTRFARTNANGPYVAAD